MLSGRHRRPAANNAKAFHRGGRALKGMTKSIGILILLLALTLGVAAAPEAVVPGGDVIGLELWSEGVCVVEFSAKAPEKAGLRTGDLICAVDGVPIATAAELTRAVEASAGAVLCLTVSRDGTEALAIPIVAGETVERLTWGQTVTQMLRMAIFCQ